MKIKRDEFLSKLHMVSAGLSSGKETLDQSSCLIFQDGKIATFNDTIACQIPSGLSDEFLGAIVARPLMTLLEKMTESEIDLVMKKGAFAVGGFKRLGEFKVQDVRLPIDAVEVPKKRHPLQDGFADAAKIAGSCALGNDVSGSNFMATCVHFTPEGLESTDRTQVVRCFLKMEIRENFLIQWKAVSKVVELGVTEFGETKNWVSFRNPEGLVYSCRRFVDNYPSLEQALKVDGVPLNLPGGLEEAVDRAKIFSSEDGDDDRVEVQLRKGKMIISGEGYSGRYKELKRVQYDGPSMEFLISPRILLEISSRTTLCKVSENRLKIDGGTFTYVTALSRLVQGRENRSGEDKKTANKDENT